MHVDTLSVNLLQAVADYNYGSYYGAIRPEDSVQVISYDARFNELMGSNVTATLTDQQDWDFAYVIR